MLKDMFRKKKFDIRLARFITVLSFFAVAFVLFEYPQANAFVINEFTIPTTNSYPFEITAGPDGNLWFTEDWSNRIGRITTAGEVTEFTFTVPDTQGPYYYATGITAGPDGNIWFTGCAESDTGMPICIIGRSTPEGVITEFRVPGYSMLEGIAVGPDGNLWFADNYYNEIGRITTDGVITQFPANGNPKGITAGPDGNIWFTEYGSPYDYIGRLTPGGDIAEFTFNTAGPFENYVDYQHPEQITAGPDGNLWFTLLSGNKIGRITTDGLISEFMVPAANSEPTGITAGPDGNIWFTEGYYANKIGRITPAGIITEFAVPTINSNPYGITTGPDGDIWFTEYSANKIGQVVIAPPQTQIAAIIDFFDSSVSGGNLTGAGPTATSADNRLGALRNMLISASNSIDSGQLTTACQQLSDVYQRCDGQPQPPDFVTGQDAPQLAGEIQSLRTTLGCQ